ncbi:divalent-cation tolerance protein CutA [Solimonas soli]|uniref:divalent-cation tolerance protein CutA n=1 Tax=Solimonas soli TaxID=413479 RepID=UPI0004893D59|nr:divalent-cation tolerance protein CutA [Solimonas soli]
MPSQSSAAVLALTFVSCPAEHADAVARTLVEQRLAACVSVLPQLRSVYRWQGAIESADEALLLIKHPAERFDALRAAVLAVHPYELPEIVMVGGDAVHRPYLDWVIASCS